MNQRSVGSGDLGRPAADKSPDAFRTISEVAEDLDLPQHVLRFWETRFTQIRPLKRGGGRRYYRRDDVELLKGIRQLLYGEGYTIKGVQRILKQDGHRFVQAVGRGETGALPPSPEDGLDLDETEPGPVPANREARNPAPHFSDSETSPGAPASGPVLDPDDISLLRSALAELVECGRVLAALRPSHELEEPGAE